MPVRRSSQESETAKRQSPKKPFFRTSISRMTQKGQVTISAGFRNALGLRPGDQVILSLQPDGTIKLERMKTFEEVMASLPLVTMEPVDWKTRREEMHEEIAEKVFRDIAAAGERRKKNAPH